MAARVSRNSRIIDLVSLVLVVAGAACYVWAYVGMEALRRAPHDPNAELFAAYTRYVRLSQLSIAGLVAVGLGVVVGIAAAFHARRATADPSLRSG